MTKNNTSKPVIVSCEVLTALGNLNETWQALMAGESSLVPVSLPDVPNVYPAGRIPLGDIQIPYQTIQSISRPAIIFFSARD